MPGGRPVLAQRAVAIADKTIANTTTETSLIGTLDKPALTAISRNEFAVGTQISIKAKGIISTHSAPGTLTIAAKYGTTVIVTKTSGTLPASLSNESLTVDIDLTVRSIGASGTIFGAGVARITSAGAFFVIPITATAAVTVNQTNAGALDATATWSVNDAANTLTIQVCEIEIKEPK